MVSELLQTVLATFVGLLPIANPFSTAVVFLVITSRFSEAHRQQQARLACLYMAGVLWTFLFAGALIMSFFGISIPAVRIAGGLIVARIGFGMLSPHEAEAVADASPRTDVAFTPLAVPMLSGPGSIAVTIGMAAGATTVFEYAAIAAGIALVALLSWLVLRSARRVKGLLGDAGLDALTRIMGFLLVCVGIQFIGIGVAEIGASETFMRPIVQTIEALR